MKLSEFLWTAWCGRRVDAARLRRMDDGDEPIPASWAEAIQRSTGGEVRIADWNTVTAKSADEDPVPHFPSLSESDRLQRFDKLVDRRRRSAREIGRRARRNVTHPVYQWLDDIGRNLTWLADEIGSSRPSLQTFINGFRRRQGGNIQLCSVPSEIARKVEMISNGRVTEADWKQATGLGLRAVDGGPV